ncbi:helix-turn-helix domain-containing protein [Taklimakanibacter deserti]|uniref:helix-turn-helix domain-containing protein n=1 Tax=Taklimakanibacter deserti TaxID=2267839 RepID=UPI000E65C0D2
MSGIRHLRIEPVPAERSPVAPAQSVTVDAALLASVVAALGGEDFYAALRAFINGIVRIDNCVALVFDRQGPPLILHQWSPQQPNYFQMLYSQGAYTLDPFYRASLDERRDGVMLLKDIAPDGFGESDFYKAYYEKVNMIDEIGLLCPVDEQRTMHLSLGRRCNSCIYAADDLAHVKRLRPLLSTLLLKQYHLQDAGRDAAGHQAPEHAGQWLKPFHVTAREAEIADMILRGHSNASMGVILAISAETVKVHRKNLYAKMRISSQAELFQLFISHILPQRAGQPLA